MPTIRDPLYPQRRADHYSIRQLLGLNSKAKLPDAGMEPREIQGLLVWVTPRYPRPRVGKSSKHRVRCRCPECGQELSVGRLGQHKCTKKGVA